MEKDLKQGCKCAEETEEQKIAKIDKVIEEYNRNPQNLIQILHYAQGIYGFIPPSLQQHIADSLNMPVSKVSGVVSFYSFFSSKQKGKHTIRVCLGTACYVRGSKKVLNSLKEELGIDVGDTTSDGKFTLEVMRCIGACGLAPAMTIDEKVYRQVNSEKIKNIISEY